MCHLLGCEATASISARSVNCDPGVTNDPGVQKLECNLASRPRHGMWVCIRTVRSLPMLALTSLMSYSLTESFSTFSLQARSQRESFTSRSRVAALAAAARHNRHHLQTRHCSERNTCRQASKMTGDQASHGPVGCFVLVVIVSVVLAVASALDQMYSADSSANTCDAAYAIRSALAGSSWPNLLYPHMMPIGRNILTCAAAWPSSVKAALGSDGKDDGAGAAARMQPAEQANPSFFVRSPAARMLLGVQAATRTHKAPNLCNQSCNLPAMAASW